MSDQGFPSLTGGSRLVRRRLQHTARQAWEQFEELSRTAPEDLPGRFAALRTEVRARPVPDLLESDLPLALALAAFASERTLGLRPYPVQILGAVVVASGSLAQMQTGEGKTLATALAATVLSLPGRGVHVATANEYLAGRDAAHLRPLADLLGFTVGLSRVVAEPADRRAAHACDVVYGTATSLGFDYLYDNLAIDIAEIACKDPYAALVDEVDSVLLDEALTPLLIAGRSSVTDLDFTRFAQLAAGFTPGRDLFLDEAKGAIAPLGAGLDRVEAVLGVANLYEHDLLAQQLHTALTARFLQRNGVEYILAGEPDPEVVLVDPNTGRRRERSRLRSGHHEAIEAKEGLDVKESGVTRAAVSVQTFFARYPRLGGMSGTAVGGADEFETAYGLDVYAVPTNRPACRTDHPDRIYATAAQRDEALRDEVVQLVSQGRPVLVVTDSVLECERLGTFLAEHHPVTVLSARNPQDEADIFALAGTPGAVTVATAMAGRGVDILLGGRPASPGYQQDRAAAIEAGGLAVLSTARFPSRRVDDQLRGRAGRQGEPGSSQFFLSFQDELVRLYAPDALAGLLDKGEGELPARFAAPVFARAQAAKELEHLTVRQAVLKADRPLARHRDVFYAYRRSLLAAAPWQRAAAVLRSALTRRLPEQVTSPEQALAALGAFWPGVLPFPPISTPAPRTEVVEELTTWFMFDLKDRLGPVGQLEEHERLELLVRLVGSMTLDALDKAWASHLESAASLFADSSLTARVGQKPENIYRSRLEDSFREVFRRFEYVAIANLGGLRIDSVSRSGVSL